MKLLVVVITAVFASCDCLSKVDVDAPSVAFLTGGNAVISPIIEGQSSGDLRDLILNQTARYVSRIVKDLSRQVIVKSHLQVALIWTSLENFEYQLNQLPPDATTDASLDEPLQFVNDNIQAAFDLIPSMLGGNATINARSRIDDDKSFPSGVEISPTHTLRDLMNNLSQVLDGDLEMLFKYQTKLLTAGYKGLGRAYGTLQDEFRSMAINEYILPALQSVIFGITSEQRLIEPHVNLSTWRTFLALNHQLKTVIEKTSLSAI